jgi:hypothetical protein
MAEALDYSAGFPGAARIKAAGYVGAIRYIGFPGRRKCTNRAELDDFTANGLGMALVYQDGTGDWLGGYDGGRAAAGRARGHADSIGFPGDRPIYFAIDRDVVSAPEFNAVVEYLRGASSVLGVDRVGVYGEYDVTVRCRSAGVASWYWQCRAWSGTPVRLDPERHVYQRVGQVNVGGIGCDVNDVLKSDWGQHTEDDVGWNDTLQDWDDPDLKGPAWVFLVQSRKEAERAANTATEANARLDQLEAKVDEIARKLDQLGGGTGTGTSGSGIDLEALAARVAALVSQQTNGAG